MCGISAVYRYTTIAKDDLKHVKSMNDQMRYRGPDGEGYWHDAHCALGHVRLSIIGTENGSQPLYNQDKSLVLVCNGEIYNYIEPVSVRIIRIGVRASSAWNVCLLFVRYEEATADCSPRQDRRGACVLCRGTMWGGCFI